MNNKRTLNTNKRIDETIIILGHIIAALNETKNSKKSLMQCCRERNLDGVKIRNIIPSVLNTQIGKKKAVEDYAGLTGPYEKLYMDIFGIKEKDFMQIDIPFDFEESVNHVINTHLTEQEKMIITKRYGLDDNIQHTCNKIGQIENLGGDRIRHIQAGALRKLRYKECRDILVLGLEKYRIQSEHEKNMHKINLEYFNSECKAAVQDLQKEHEEKLNDIANGKSQAHIINVCKKVAISELHLSVRAENALRRSGQIYNFYDLVCYPDIKLSAMKNVGKNTFTEIKNKTDKFAQIKFNMSTAELKKHMHNIPCSQLQGQEIIINKCKEFDLYEMHLTTKFVNALKRGVAFKVIYDKNNERLKMKTLYDLLQLSETDILGMPNIGEKRYNEAKIVLNKFTEEVFHMPFDALRGIIH